MKKAIAQFILCLLIAFSVVFTTSCDKDDNTPPDTDNNGDNNGDDNGDDNGDINGDNNGDETATCPQTVDYEGHTYQTVEIGEQCWFAENLRYLPEVFPPTNGSDTEIRYYVSGFSYTSVEDAKAHQNYANYGVLYNWPAAQSACPDGWKIPADSDWTALTDFLGGHTTAGGKLKQAGTEFWNTPNTDATNETGFNALPGGRRSSTGFFEYVTNIGYWWTSTEFSATNAWGRIMQYNTASAGRDAYAKKHGLSVRCLKE